MTVISQISNARYPYRTKVRILSQSDFGSQEKKVELVMPAATAI